MGPALKNRGNIISLLGVKGGVGCSILASLLARSAAKTKKIRVGIIDGSAFSHSLASTYYSVSEPKHYLTQLLPYSDHLTPNLIESYFSETPEGAVYIPVREIDSEDAAPENLIPLLGKLAPLFDSLVVDLSSFPPDQHLKFIEMSSSVLLISSLETSALKSVALWEKKLLSLHLKLDHFNLVLNQQSPSQVVPANISSLSKYFNHLGTVGFLGGDFNFEIFEKNVLTSPIIESLNAIVEKMAHLDGGDPKVTPARLKNNSTGETTFPAAGNDPISLALVNELHQKLLEKLRLSGALKEQKSSDSLQRKTLEPAAKEILNQLIQDMKIEERESRRALAAETLNLAFGLGPLEPLLHDDEVTEIMVNGPQQVYIERKGIIEKTNICFLNDQQLRTIIERILAPIGRRIDESRPYVDGRLADGSRVNAVIPPLSLNGSIITIRKFSRRKLTVDDLIKFGSLTGEAAEFLGACVRAKINIIVSGGTGSGKTTLLNILSNHIPGNERIVTIEDSAELQLSQEHVVRLESRPANLEGNGQVTIRDLVTNALRMRPDRIVVGECRGGEALDMLQAMNTGHNGSLTTAHANSPRDVLSRLETMCLFAGLDLPLRAIREQISRAIQLVVQQSRLPDGKRTVTQISEVQGLEGDVIVTQDLFYFDGEKGLQRRPYAPSFIDELNPTGYVWPGRIEKKEA